MAENGKIARLISKIVGGENFTKHVQNLPGFILGELYGAARLDGDEKGEVLLDITNDDLKEAMKAMEQQGLGKITLIGNKVYFEDEDALKGLKKRL